jgi:SAM-dependent methyltransferase
MSEFDSYAPRYDDLLRDPLRDRFTSGSAFFHWRKWELIRRFFAERERDTHQLDWLDVGCGQGELLKLGSANFRHVAGCDPSANMIAGLAVTRSMGVDVRAQSQAAELPFPDQSFDFITAVCVYHHVHGPDRALLTESIRRVLRPGGIFCMIEHNPWNPATRLIVKRCPVDIDAELLSAPFAKRLLRSGQLNPIETSYFLYLPEQLYKAAPWVESALRSVAAGGQYALFSQKQ